MFNFDVGDFVPLMAMSIPIVAIVGGITAGIVRMIQRQRAFEMVQRERIAAIERGLDPDKIASLQRPLLYDDHGVFTDPVVAAEHRRQGMLIGGLVTLFVGIGLSVFLYGIDDHGDHRVWLVGTIPAAVGVALLLSTFLIKPIASSPRPPER
ncbi:MAG TPA: hypothetical protein VN896_08190 [Methylomirabilota bacterium]|nr:hypothetical protein [Methylomirabilota bacterium]